MKKSVSETERIKKGKKKQMILIYIYVYVMNVVRTKKKNNSIQVNRCEGNRRVKIGNHYQKKNKKFTHIHTHTHPPINIYLGKAMYCIVKSNFLDPIAGFIFHIVFFRLFFTFILSFFCYSLPILNSNL